MKSRELQLRVRGLEEEEKIKEKILKIFSELVERSTEELGCHVDKIVRLRNRRSTKEGWTNDVIVHFNSRSIKEEIIKASYDNPIEFNGRKVMLIRELPKQVVTFRRDMRKLTEKLWIKKIWFRWEVPLGISFIWNEKHITIKTEEQMEAFLSENGKDLIV